MDNLKTEKLDSILKSLKSFVIAYSGGVDSTFLLHRASQIKGIHLIAATVRTTYMQAREIEEAADFCRSHGINSKIIDFSFPEIIRDNPVERCYLCKKLLFTELLSFARKNDFKYVIDGTNSDDNGDFRPGLKALSELGIRSPLMESGLVKTEIRQLSEKARLPTWNKPAYACLLTRIPYGTRITDDGLRMVEDAEQFLFEKGFPGTRVRLHGDMARIECLHGYFDKMIRSPDREQIVSKLKKIGFKYISLDIEGYRTGSFNPDKNNYDKK